MHTINYTTAQAHLAETMDRVNEDQAPLLVTRQKGEPVVMMSLAEYNALEETAYLLRSSQCRTVNQVDWRNARWKSQSQAIDRRMNIEFTPTAWEDYLWFQQNDKTGLKRINLLIKAIQRQPFEGVGNLSRSSTT